jgi:glycosyltransferase involved in cell wall biosynthesis
MPNVYPGRAAARGGVPLVLSPRGMLGPAALRYSRHQKQLFWQLLQKRALRSVTCFHATAEAEVADIRDFGLSGPVAVIPNGIDVNDLAPVTRPADARRRVLHLGRIHPKKGIDRLLRAWALLAEVCEGWELCIVGPSEGGHKADLERLARDLGLDNVQFEAPIYGAEKAMAYAEAELFVLPTIHENFGMVVAEALAQRTPVISTIGAPWQGLVANRCGWWIEHGPGPLAAALREAMVLDDATRAEMGARGRVWMQRDFSWDSIAEDMDRLYRWCSGTDDKPEFVVI